MPVGLETPRIGAALLGAGHPADPALVEGTTTTTYAELRERVAARAERLDLPARSVVLVQPSPTTEGIATYLAVLAAGHVPLLAGAHLDRLADAWQPAAVITTSAEGAHVERRPGPDRALHPDLALLLSTSGSTGAPKLVRLSHRNLTSNADAIVEVLGLTAADRGITSLPLHYCYGLSVLHAHLRAGAALVLTNASVVDPCFRAAMADHGVTNVAGVPHSFDLLEHAGPEHVHVPSLRFLTVAGGRLAPERVGRWLDRADAWGIDLHVMYGQTEATARMAVLPPALARRHPGAIGRPIPGGSLSLRPVDGQPDGVGELVYRGDNVMMGYATTDADLAAEPELDELATGDLGRYHPEADIFEVVGRRSRFVKPFGTRVDLDEVERVLSATRPEVAVTGDDRRLVVGAPGADPAAVVAAVADLTGIPARAVVVDVDPIPRTAADKVDYAELHRRAGDEVHGGDGHDEVAASGHDEAAASGHADSVAALFTAVLGATDVRPDDTFVSLGGDSLSYIECAERLEPLIGPVPADWHLQPVADLERLAGPAPGRSRRLARVDTTVPLRALGIALIVSTHMRLLWFPGGAHLLLALVGYNLSRFQLPVEPTAARLRAGLRTVGRVALPTMAWVATGMVLLQAYSAGTLLFANGYVGPRHHDGDHWHFWFIEVFVHLCVATTLLLAVPRVRRLERRHPYAFPLALLALTLALRHDWSFLGDPDNLRFRTHGVAWIFVLGWLVHRSTTVRARLLTTVLLVATLPGFFGRPEREWFVVATLALLLWAPQVPLPRALVRPVTAVAAASMWIFITHFSVWPVAEDHLPLTLAYVVTVSSGVLAAGLADRLSRAGRPVVRFLGAALGQRGGRAEYTGRSSTVLTPGSAATT